MSDEQHLPERHYDPLTSERRPRQRSNVGVVVAVSFAVVFHGLLVVYLTLSAQYESFALPTMSTVVWSKMAGVI